MKITKQELKTNYQELSRSKKVSLGMALVKVNLGVAEPKEVKEVAEFIKGSPYLAQKGGLERLITFLNENEGKKEEISRSKSLSDSLIKGLKTYPQDLEKTKS